MEWWKERAWNQKDGGEEGEQAIPGNYRASANSRSFADFKIQEPLPPTIDVKIIIVNKINNQIRKYYITITPLNGEHLTTLEPQAKQYLYCKSLVGRRQRTTVFCRIIVYGFNIPTTENDKWIDQENKFTPKNLKVFTCDRS